MWELAELHAAPVHARPVIISPIEAPDAFTCVEILQIELVTPPVVLPRLDLVAAFREAVVAVDLLEAKPAAGVAGFDRLNYLELRPVRRTRNDLLSISADRSKDCVQRRVNPVGFAHPELHSDHWPLLRENVFVKKSSEAKPSDFKNR